MAKAVIYATTLLTKKTNMPIAKYISKKGKTDIFDLKDLMTLNLDAYNTIIFGTKNNSGAPDKLVAEFIQKNEAVLAKKKKFLYVITDKDDEKSKEQADAIAKTLGLADAFVIPKKSEQLNDEALPVALDDFIAKI